jgi:hypothetical protein
LSLFILVCLINYFVPKLEFSKTEYNRAFGIFFHIYSLYTLFILLKIFLKIKSIILRNVSLTFIGFFFLITILNFTFYLMKIDPQTQYKDVEVKYFNKNNKFERIIKQYRVNWKTNEKTYQENKVYDIGPFRYFMEYDVDSSKLNNEWQKV